MTKATAIIQARFGSKRLEGKILKNIQGKPLIEWVINSARKIKGVNNIVLATTNLKEDDVTCDIAKQNGIEYFRGDSENVLHRFNSTAKEFNADPIIRICGDSPLIASEYFGFMLEEHIRNRVDLTGNESPFPIGPIGEIVSANALEIADRNADKPYQLEHVTPYIHENSKANFKIIKTAAPKNLRKGFRLTVDTESDLRMFEHLFAALSEGGLEINLLNALKILDKRQDIVDINSDVRQRDWRK